jgi:hypothetical protein
VKSYPSIPRRPKGKQAGRPMHLFDKLDGSNLRFEWSREQGWFRWGSRTQPAEFLQLFAAHDLPAYLGEVPWDDALLARVGAGTLPGITCEGVVGKAGAGHTLVMAKAKTDAWVRRILERYGEAEGRALVDS